MLNELFHPSYSDALVDWLLVEDVCAGERTVKGKGDTYLPRLHKQSDTEYESFKRRATWLGATKRTKEAMIGMLMRKPAKITSPETPDFMKLLADVDLQGGSIKNWVRTSCGQGVSTGRSVSVIDYNETEKRPYIAFYPAVNVVNWHEERHQGANKLVLLVLKESTETRSGSTVTIQELYREYRINEAGNCEMVTKTPTKNGDGAESMTESDPVEIKRAGKPLTFVPAYCHNATHLGWSIGEIPLLDIANSNIHLYMGSADLWNGRHVGGVPTPWATGVDETTELVLGTTKAWVTSDPLAKFGWLEYEGQGLQSLEKGCQELKDEMAMMGARLLGGGGEKKAVEAFDTVRLRNVAESASLANISGYQSATLTQAFRTFIWWTELTKESPADIDDKYSIVVNDDFVDAAMDSATLTALVAAFQGDAISFETFYFQLEKGEIYPTGWDLAKETAAIGQRPAVTVPEPPAPAPGPGPKPAPAAK